MKATILRAGFLTTVQDLGRAGVRDVGVALGGAADPHALKIANLLVGNEASSAGLELTSGTVRMQCDDDCLIAWCGGAYRVRAGDREIPPGRAGFAAAGQEITVISEGGARAWVALSGGIDVPLVLGSRATDLRSGFGGLSGRALIDGDVLEIGIRSPAAERLSGSLKESQVATFGAPAAWTRPSIRGRVLRIVRGADWVRFSEHAQRALTSQSYEVSREADRMGVRLESGVELVRSDDGSDLVSEAVTPGTLQLPPNGQPILLLADCQTIGGYPKIAHVITVDLPIAAQLQPGDQIRFMKVSLSTAQQLLREQQRDLAWFRAGLTLRMS
jgi:antagonist of KipI